jgi:hypothetical protein
VVSSPDRVLVNVFANVAEQQKIWQGRIEISESVLEHVAVAPSPFADLNAPAETAHGNDEELEVDVPMGAPVYRGYSPGPFELHFGSLQAVHREDQCSAENVLLGRRRFTR